MQQSLVFLWSLYACFVLFPGLCDTGLESLCKLSLLPLAWLKLQCTFSRASHSVMRSVRRLENLRSYYQCWNVSVSTKNRSWGPSWVQNEWVGFILSYSVQLNLWFTWCKSGVAHLSHSLHAWVALSSMENEKDAILQYGLEQWNFRMHVAS